MANSETPYDLTSAVDISDPDDDPSTTEVEFILPPGFVHNMLHSHPKHLLVATQQELAARQETTGRTLLEEIDISAESHIGNVYIDTLDDEEFPVPRSYLDIVRMPAHFQRMWLLSMAQEIRGLQDTGTLEEVPRDAVLGRALDVKLVFTIKKPDEFGRRRLKTRLVARGDQEPIILGGKQWAAPTVQFSVLRALVIRSLTTGHDIYKFDIGQAFLRADLDPDEQIFIRIRDSNGAYTYYQVHRSIYGLRSSPGRWYKLISETLMEFGLKRCDREHCLFLL